MEPMKTATLTFGSDTFELPTVEGSEGEVGVDVRSLRSETGLITFDPGYGNTGSCESAITFIDGERGILRHRGYPIEELADRSSFLEVAYLLIFGELPTAREREVWEEEVTRHTLLHEDMKKFFEGFPPSAHPMTVLSAMVASLAAYYSANEDPEALHLNIIR
ncbi:MAG: citrate (Si)-synthase, partial [Coriobacteriia bacterium]|nr:citrate (Si)-synthase [Coriobacteriia bacterium]